MRAMLAEGKLEAAEVEKIYLWATPPERTAPVSPAAMKRVVVENARQEAGRAARATDGANMMWNIVKAGVVACLNIEGYGVVF